LDLDISCKGGMIDDDTLLSGDKLLNWSCCATRGR
jgi:hypothetical protein